MQLYEVEVALAAFFMTATVVIYGFVPWWRTWAGRILFAVLAGFATVLVVVATSFLLGDYPGREYVRHFIYLSILIISIAVFSSMLSVQIRGRRNRKKLEALIAKGTDDV